MSNDALERLKKKKRPSVPQRDSSLQSNSLDISIPSNVDNNVSREQETFQQDKSQSVSNQERSEKQNEKTLEQKISRYKDIQNSLNQIESLQTKQTTLRLEVEIGNRLSKICQENKIGREVLLEALLEYYEQDDEAWGKILTEAKKKADLRMQFANLKRTRSMIEKLNSINGT
jgi:hypothetical protein